MSVLMRADDLLQRRSLEEAMLGGMRQRRSLEEGGSSGCAKYMNRKQRKQTEEATSDMSSDAVSTMGMPR